jgi:general secretion pathway protein G
MLFIETSHSAGMTIVSQHFHDGRGQRDHRDIADPEAGLTLIEMLVVLVIIGVIAGMIVMNVANRPDEARVTTAKTDMRTISAALKMYRLDNGDYPTTEQGLAALATRPTIEPLPRNWSPEGYLERPPEDPWGRSYVYRYPGSGTGFDLMSLGKDGKPGGEGLDADLSDKAT